MLPSLVMMMEFMLPFKVMLFRHALLLTVIPSIFYDVYLGRS